MHVSNINLLTDEDEIFDFITKFSFATIVTARDNRPTATHLPFVVSKRGDKTILTSHFGKANTQWQELLDHEVLVIFTEPHAYISPANYEKELNVPTWNYISVHTYGKATLLQETDQAFKVLENTITNYEAGYLEQWNNLPQDYKVKMLKGIVAFEIEVTTFQGSKKLSQNKTEAEKKKIIETLTASPSEVERQIADYMKKEDNG